MNTDFKTILQSIYTDGSIDPQKAKELPIGDKATVVRGLVEINAPVLAELINGNIPLNHFAAKNEYIHYFKHAGHTYYCTYDLLLHHQRQEQSNSLSYPKALYTRDKITEIARRKNLLVSEEGRDMGKLIILYNDSNEPVAVLKTITTIFNPVYMLIHSTL